MSWFILNKQSCLSTLNEGIYILIVIRPCLFTAFKYFVRSGAVKRYTLLNNRESTQKIAWACDWYRLKANIFYFQKCFVTKSCCSGFLMKSIIKFVKNLSFFTVLNNFQSYKLPLKPTRRGLNSFWKFYKSISMLWSHTTTEKGLINFPIFQRTCPLTENFSTFSSL